MALLFGRQRRVANFSGTYPGYGADWAGATAAQLVPARGVSPGPNIAAVTPDTAMRHSAVWACLRLRANLLSTLPVDTFRMANGFQVETPKPPIFIMPDGDRVDWTEHIYSSQIDLDRTGNSFGLITERNGHGLPARIDLVPHSLVSVRWRDGEWWYRIDGVEYPPGQVWHEKQYTISGLPVGLSPIAYAAWTIGEFLSIQDFALTWFGSGGVPRAHLRNRMQTISSSNAEEIKNRYKTTVAAGDLFVTGADWEYNMIQAEQTGMEWINAKRFSVEDIARFFDVPEDLIGGGSREGTGSITYANISQRNLQFLIMHLGPTIVRREAALSRLLPRPRFVKFNTSALLRMDDETRAQVIRKRIAARTLTPNEARALENMPPLTDSDYAQFERLFGDPNVKKSKPAGLDGDSETDAEDRELD